MNENRRRILDMLAEGKVDVEEAERLLALLERPIGSDSPTSAAASPRREPVRYLRVTVEPNAEARANNGGERVNIRVPMALIRAGMKLHALIPSSASTGINQALKDKGIDLDVRSLKAEDLEQLIDAMTDLEIDVQDGDQHVRVYFE